MLPWLERFARDVRYGLRTLLRTPMFTTVAVLTFALGIGANTAIFSVVNAVLLRPLPLARPAELVMFEEKRPPRLPHFEASPLNFLSWKEQGRAYTDLAAYAKAGYNLAEEDRPERLLGARVSANLFSVLGVEPILGRTFTADEDQPGRDQVVVIGYDLWQRRFGGSPGVLGRKVRVGGLTYEIIGVMPPRFRFPDAEEFWKPIAFSPRDLASRSNHYVWVVGRLKPGVTAEAAQAEMDVISRRLTQQFPGSNTGWSGTVYPLASHYVGGIRTALLILFAAVSLVLLIACANIANLLLARASSRQREVAVRASLGATRGQIVRQLLIESAWLALLGGTVGVLLAQGGLRIMLQFTQSLARFDEVTIDAWALAFTFGVSLVAGVAFGVAPALRLAMLDLRESLNAESKGGGGSAMRRGTRAALVVAEVALALVLLIGAGLLTKSFQRLSVVDPGFRPDHVLTAQISLPTLKYPDPPQQTQFVDALLRRARSLPGATDVAISTSLPFSKVTDVGIRFDRPPDAAVTGTIANYYAVTPDYFRVLGVRLLKGRLLTAHDIAGGPPVVVINETMAKRFFADQDPIGTRLDISGPTYMREIVGIVADVKQDGLNAEAQPQVYEPYGQKPNRGLYVLLRTAGDPATLAESLRRDVTAIDPDQPISQAMTMEQLVGRTLAPHTLSAMLFGAFAMLGLALAAVGVYGVMAYSVAQRTREIGVRMALGQPAGSILRMVLGQSLALVSIGIGLGLLAAFLLSRYLKSLLFEVDTTDPMIFALFSAVLLATALVAAAIPARRAARVDPLVALQARE
jgi:putative ABC transport system permease protein